MTTPIPLVYFDKGKAPRVVGPMAPDPMDIIERQDIISYLRHPQNGARPAPLWEAASPAMVEAVLRTVRRQREKAVHAAGNAPPARERPWREAESREDCSYFNPPGRGVSVVAENNAMVLVLRATTALREYLRLHDRGGHLAPWLRDGKRFRVVDARDQAYARGDASMREVAGALLALTREQLEAVRRAAGVSADIGRVKPEGEW